MNNKALLTQARNLAKVSLTVLALVPTFPQHHIDADAGRVRSQSKPCILVLADYFLPGFKAGGPIRSLANLVQQLGDEFRFRIVTRDRDSGDPAPYPGISVNSWRTLGKAEVFYLSPPRSLARLLHSVIADSDCTALYLNSFLSPVFTVQTLLLRKFGLIPEIPIIVAPRGEFSSRALQHKAWKKRLYLPISSALALYKDVTWQASSSHEEEDIRRFFGERAKVVVAPNIAIDTRDGLCAERPAKRQGSLRVVSIARIARHKNLAFALRRLEKASGQIEFNIYGPIENQSYWRECQQLISRMPQNIRVNYHGSLSPGAVIDKLRQHHLLFLPTLSENFGHVIAEALLASCPVLISDQTPWRNLEFARAGWDLPLDRKDLFERTLRICVEMDQDTLDEWSAGARAIGAAGLQADALDRNRTLLRMTSTMPPTAAAEGAA